MLGDQVIEKHRLAPINEYLDMNSRRNLENENQLLARTRTSTFPGARRGSLLQAERGFDRSIFSFREEEPEPESSTCFSSHHVDTINSDHEFQSMEFREVPTEASEWSIYRSLPEKLHKNKTLKVHPCLAKKSSSCIQFHLTTALFIFACCMAAVLLLRTFNSSEEDHVDLKAFLQILSNIEDTNKAPKASRRRGVEKKTGPRCCKYMKISSEGPVLEMYPHVLGTYKNIKEDHESPVYKHVIVNRRSYIARPEGVTEDDKPTYTWGVNSKEGAKWGWIKAMEDQPCPHMVTLWGAFVSEGKSWMRDSTLEIKCSTKYGE